MLTDSIDFGYGPKNIRKSVSDLGKLKLLNNDLITSASTGFFFRLGLFNNFLEASTMLRTKSECSQLKTLLLKLRSTSLSSKAKSKVSKYANGFNTIW
jgi:hypothetical protein